MAIPEIGIRPHKPRYRDTTNETPDIIIQDLTNTNIQYLCYRYYGADGVHVYKICRISKVSDGVFEKTLFEYPFGCASYDFDVEYADGYPYALQY